jgi:hypothetical protein
VSSIDWSVIRTSSYPLPSRGQEPSAARWLWSKKTAPMEDYPRVAVLVIGDGRDVLRRATLRSFIDKARGIDIREVVEVDDRAHTLGFCGAIQAGWNALIEIERSRRASGDTGWDYIFHLEEDWFFDRPFNVREMARILDVDSSVVQVSLLRGAENAAEREAGGLYALWPGMYYQAVDPPSVAYVKHDLYWTTNPSLYTQGLIGMIDWPDGPRCEEAFGKMLALTGSRFAVLGRMDDEPWITHTGQRQGVGY